MNYLKIYYNLIQKAKEKSRTKDSSALEFHHIIPKSLGGSNEGDNLVALTFREHYMAHLLLARITNTKQMLDALNIIGNTKKCKINSYLYEVNRIKRINLMIGRKHSLETITKMKIKANNRSDEYKSKQSIAHKGKVTSDKTKQKLSDINKNRTKDCYCKYCKKYFDKQSYGRYHDKKCLKHPEFRSDLRSFKKKKKLTEEQKQNISNATKKQTKFKCKYCDMITTKGNINRWHNENCKYKKEKQ